MIGNKKVIIFEPKKTSKILNWVQSNFKILKKIINLSKYCLPLFENRIPEWPEFWNQLLITYQKANDLANEKLIVFSNSEKVSI